PGAIIGPMESVGRGRWPFVGRDEEVATLAAEVADPDVIGIVVSGPAGVGKTRLVQELTSTAAVPPLWWRAAAAVAEVPFGALASVLAGREEVTPAAAYRQVAALLADGGGVVVVDDVPHLDARSADLLHRLVEAGKATVLATARSETPIPPWLEWLWVHDEVRRHDLGPLTPDDVATLAADVLDDLPTAGRASVTATVVARSAGNALFVRELLLDARARHRTGRPPAAAADVPAHLLKVLDARRRVAGEAAGAALTATALLGSLPIDLLAERVGVEAVVAAEDAGLVTVDGGDRAIVRPTHPLHAEAALAALSVARRRTSTVEVGAVVLAHPASTRSDRLAAVAALVRQGTPPALEHLVEAARTAFSALDHELAVEIARAAVDAGDPFEARVVLGAALSGAGRDTEAEAALREALAVARDDDERARAAGRISVHLVAHGARIAEADALLAEVEATIGDPAARAFLHADRAKLATIRGEVVAPGPVPGDDGVAVLNAAIAGAYVQAVAGDAGACRATIAGALPLVAEHRHVLPWASELVRFSGPFAALVAEGPVAAVEDADDGLSRAEPTEEATTGTWRFLRGFAATVAGDLERADADLARSARELSTHDLIGARPLAIATRGWAAAQCGDVDRARALLDEALPAATIDGRVRIQVAVADAWCDVVEGRATAAVPKLVTAAQRAAEEGQLVAAVLALNEGVRAGAAASVASLVARLVEPAPPSWLFALVRDRARAEADADPEALGRLARRAEGRWPAATAELHAARARFLHGRDPALAARATVAALVAARALRSPRPWSLHHLEWPLTDREREVAERVAHGVTNRAVAEESGVSVRTIENQLQSIYRKLGLQARHELTEVMGTR
ncbi:MAG TPA: LuxR family transcriptional regulator, partial [Iamia sp.]|nr:LuxR family transcriptional regulator [Iamia sp.]